MICLYLNSSILINIQPNYISQQIIRRLMMKIALVYPKFEKFLPTTGTG